MSSSVETILLKTHRFVFSKEIIDCMAEFAKIHQYDDRKTFKESWQTWIKDEDVETMMNIEIKRLSNLGFEGDVMDKMFKSTRYYYRNKSDHQNNETEKKMRKSYEKFSTDILENIDEHIHRQIKASSLNKKLDNKNLSIISPAESFNHYLLENKAEILKHLKDEDKVTKKDVEEMIQKYKKTYKNRFYNIRVVYNNQ